MKRTLLLCVIVAIALIARTTPSTAATKADIKLFTVQLSVFETKNGQDRALAQPVMVVRDNEPASFLAGGEVPDPVRVNGDKAVIEYVPYGIQASLTVREVASDKLLVSLGVSDDVLEDSKSGDFTIRRSGIRCLRTVRPGDAIVLDMGEGRTAKVIVTPTAAK